MSEQRHYLPTASNRDRCELFRQILPMAFSVRVCRLNCYESVARQSCSMSIEEVLTEFETSKSLQWTAIYAPAVHRWQITHWEFCVSSMGRKVEDLFVWVMVRPDIAERIFKENADIFKQGNV